VLNMWGGGDSWGMPGMMTGQQDLVNKVKTWQRQSTGHRKAWELYCQVNGTTKFDPSAKEVTFLQAFLEAAEAGQIPVEQESSFERSEKQPLVEAVKRWQRQGQGHKEAWWKFCGQHGSADYDPNRHEIAFLQTFLSDCESGVIQPEAVSADGMGCGCGKGGKGKGKGKGKSKEAMAAGWDAFMMGMFHVWLMKGKGKGKGGEGGDDAAADGGCEGMDAMAMMGMPGMDAMMGMGGMGGGGTAVGEIRYDDPTHAYDAGATLDGTQINGCTISIKLDPRSQDGTKLIVEGLPSGIEWQELKDHFNRVGPVAYAGVKEQNAGGGAAGGLAQMMMMMKGKAAGKGSPSGYSPY